MARILVIDDDITFCDTMQSLLFRLRHTCIPAHSLEKGLGYLEGDGADVVLLDVWLPDGNGLDALPRIGRLTDPPEIIILTGAGDPDGAELAVQSGVWDYIVKPSSVREISLSLSRALKFRMERKGREQAYSIPLEFGGVVGDSSAMRKTFGQIARAAATDSGVLITGETGTGKELFARTIHRNSTRRDGPFVVVDCAALPEHLVESTLFGHKRGAFTGAQSDHEGLVRLADGGTLFLDEIGELSPQAQRTFLRFLQERTFRPVGSTQEIRSDFRLIAATNRDLDALADEGRYRKDLLFRLKTIHVELPPLRERLEDLKPLTQYFVSHLCEQRSGCVKGFSQDFFARLAVYSWPGNVRELFNVLERACALSGDEPTLYPAHLPPDVRGKIARACVSRITATSGTISGSGYEGSHVPGVPLVPTEMLLDGPLPTLRHFKHHMERLYLAALQRRCGKNINEMMETSGLSRSHFYSLLKKHDTTLS